MLAALSAVECLVTAAVLLSIPSDPKNAFLFGFSPFRLLNVAALIGLGAALLWVFVIISKSKKILDFLDTGMRNEQRYQDWITILLLAATLVGVLMWQPDVFFGKFLPYYQRLKPNLVLLGVFCTQGFLYLAFLKTRESTRDMRGISTRIWQNAGKTALIGITIALLGWLVIALTGLGTQESQEALNSAGVPLLVSQVIIIISSVYFGSSLFRRMLTGRLHPSKKQADIWIMVALFLIALTAWSLTPLEANYFVKDSFLQEGRYLPYSDAAHWDMGGLFALIGQGIYNNDAFMDHSALMAFLAFLHTLVGFDYQKIVFLQIVVYASAAVVAYVLGKSLLHRKAGLVFSGLVIVREVNAIKAGAFMNTSNVKLLMTEVPIMIGLMIVSLMLFLAVRAKRLNRWYALPIGSVMALMVLTRLNSLVLPAAVFLGLIVLPKFSFKDRLRFALFMTAACVFTLTPWMVRTWQIAGTPFFFLGKAMLVFKDNFRSSWLSNSANLFSVRLAAEGVAAAGWARGAARTFLVSGSAFGGAGNLVWQTANHFFRNILASVFTLPILPISDHTLADTIQTALPFWSGAGRLWFGPIPIPVQAGIFLNLILLAIGIGAGWKKWRWAALAPLFMYAAYTASLAIARTSGGRYLVPIEWVLLLYDGLGIVFMIDWCRALIISKEGHERKAGLKWQMPARTISLVIIIPAMVFTLGMYGLDRAVPQRFEKVNPQEFAERIVVQPNEDQSLGMVWSETQTFLGDPHSVLAHGQLLYPRYYAAGQKETTYLISGSLINVPRLEFTLIGPDGITYVVFPAQGILDQIEQGQEVFVVGCPHARNGLLVARHVFIQKEVGMVGLSSPQEYQFTQESCAAQGLSGD